jgi:hypothetical protein
MFEFTSIVIDVSKQPSVCPVNVGTLRSDIPKARPTFNGHSEVYR